MFMCSTTFLWFGCGPKEKAFCVEKDAFVLLTEPISTCVCAIQVLRCFRERREEKLCKRVPPVLLVGRNENVFGYHMCWLGRRESLVTFGRSFLPNGPKQSCVCVSKSCGLPKVTHAPQPWNHGSHFEELRVPKGWNACFSTLKPSIPISRNCGLPSVENLCFPILELRVPTSRNCRFSKVGTHASQCRNSRSQFRFMSREKNVFVRRFCWTNGNRKILWKEQPRSCSMSPYQNVFVWNHCVPDWPENMLHKRWFRMKVCLCETIAVWSAWTNVM